MKPILFQILLVLLSITIFAQGPELQHPFMSAESRDLFFINDDLGWSVGNNKKIYKTTNGGLQWYKIDISADVDLFKVHFVDENYGWIACDNGLLYTSDGGSSWNHLHEGKVFDNVYFFNKNDGILSGKNIVYPTNNGGSSIDEYTIDGTGSQDMIMDISFISNEIGWISVYNTQQDQSAVYYTNDECKSWQKLFELTNSTITGICFIDKLNGWISISSDDKYDEKIYHTYDGGSAWQAQSSADDDLGRFWNLNDIYMLDTLTGWAVGENPVLYYTVNGGSSWHEKNIQGENFMDIQFISPDKGWIASNEYLYFTDDAGANWNTYPYHGAINNINFLDELTGYAVGHYGYILKTTNSGENWEYLKPFSNLTELTDIINSSNNKIWISANNSNSNVSSIYVSTDSLESFITLRKFKEPIISIDNLETDIAILSDSLYKLDINNYIVTPITLPIDAAYTDFDFIGNDIIWLTGYTGNPVSSIPEEMVKSFLYLSIDGGITWNKKEYEQNTIIREILFTEKNIGYLIGDNGYLAKTTDGGDNWYEIDLGVNSDVLNITFPSIYNGIIICKDAIFITYDEGSYWAINESKYSISYINSFFINDNIGWVVGKEGTIYKVITDRLIDGPATALDNKTYPKNFLIYPNPVSERL